MSTHESRGNLFDSTACERFESELSAFVDEELETLDAKRVAEHVEACDGCRSMVKALAEMSSLHRADEVERVVEMVGPHGMWGDLVLRLLTDNEGRLAAVLYELGKALIAAGLKNNEAASGVRIYRERPGSILQLTRQGRRLAREHKRLRARSNRRRDGGRDVQRDGLFPRSGGVDGDEALECGRACLDQCLSLDPEHQQARIYLAHYHRMVGRFDRSRQLLRHVLRAPRLSAPMRLIAHQQLGRVFAAAMQFERAYEAECEVLRMADQMADELFQVSALTNLSIYGVKAGWFDRAEEAIARLVHDFSHQLDDLVVPTLARARDFQKVLRRNEDFLGQLRERYPCLFSGQRGA